MQETFGHSKQKQHLHPSELLCKQPWQNCVIRPEGFRLSWLSLCYISDDQAVSLLAKGGELFSAS